VATRLPSIINATGKPASANDRVITRRPLLPAVVGPTVGWVAQPGMSANAIAKARAKMLRLTIPCFMAEFRPENADTPLQDVTRV
jgi:hypothetical protein